MNGIQAGLSYQETVTLVTEICIECGISFAFPSTLKRACQQDTKKSFYCPNGHPMVYLKSTEEKLREQMQHDRLEHERQTRALQERIILEQRAKEKAEKQLKRVHKGVCPCCNKSFVNLQRHMRTKHPDVAPKPPVASINGLINKK